MSSSVVDIVITRDQAGDWLVDVPSLDGCHTYGSTLDEARANARDAIALWLESTDFDLAETVNGASPDDVRPNRLRDPAG